MLYAPKPSTLNFPEPYTQQLHINYGGMSSVSSSNSGACGVAAPPARPQEAPSEDPEQHGSLAPLPPGGRLSELLLLLAFREEVARRNAEALALGMSFPEVPPLEPAPMLSHRFGDPASGNMWDSLALAG